MGLDAYVPCSCLARGRSKPPPVEVEIVDGMAQPVSDSDEAFGAFQTWMKSACTHNRMQAASERVANWAGVRRLQDALRAAGLPMLAAALPDANGGALAADACRACLDEIAMFRSTFRRAAPQLVNTANGAIVYDYVAAYDGELAWSSTDIVGFDEDGLFVKDRTTRAERFRARRVVAIPAESGCVLRDLDGGTSVTCGWKHDVETSYEVIQHVETAADYEPILASLEVLFRAAIEHDTWVVWC